MSDTRYLMTMTDWSLEGSSLPSKQEFLEQAKDFDGVVTNGPLLLELEFLQKFLHLEFEHTGLDSFRVSHEDGWWVEFGVFRINGERYYENPKN